MKNIVKEIEFNLTKASQEVQIPMGGTLLEKILIKPLGQEYHMHTMCDPAFLLCHVEIDEEPGYEVTTTIVVVKSDEVFELDEEDEIIYLDSVVNRDKTYHIGVLELEQKEKQE